jgi:serine/threonine protein kinase
VSVTALAAAPEMVRSRPSYGIAVDLWALGVTAYELLTLMTPFLGEHKKETVWQV